MSKKKINIQRDYYEIEEWAKKGSKMSDKFGERCPICRTKWKITTFGTKIWKDCLECGDTAENLIAKSQEETPSKKYEGADWLWEEDRKNFPVDPGYWGVDYSSSSSDDGDDWDDIPFLVEIKRGSTFKEIKDKLREATQNQIVFGQAKIKWV